MPELTVREPVVPSGLRFFGPVSPSGSFFSKAHAGEYLLALADATYPVRHADYSQSQQGRQLRDGVREFLERNPEFALAGTETELSEVIRLTGGYANIWLCRKQN